MERPPRPRRRTRRASPEAIEKSRHSGVASPTHQSLSEQPIGPSSIGPGTVPGWRRAGAGHASWPGSARKPRADARAWRGWRNRRCRTAARDRNEGRGEAACGIARTTRDAKSPRFPAKHRDLSRFLDFLAETGDTTPRGGRSGSDSPLKARVVKTRAFDFLSSSPATRSSRERSIFRARDQSARSEQGPRISPKSRGSRCSLTAIHSLITFERMAFW